MKRKKLISFVLLMAMCFSGCAQTDRVNSAAANQTEPSTYSLSEESAVTEETTVTEKNAVTETERPNTENYKLKEVVVLSRHNIRSPLSSNGATHVLATPYQWVKWTANSSELSDRGGVLETMMGQYFRKWLESEELIPENYIPEGDTVRFYANSKQRTIATAQYFSSGFLPSGNVKIEHKGEFNKMDPVFDPKIDFYSDPYAEAVLDQFEEKGGKDITADLEQNYKLLAQVVDYENSEGYKSGELKPFVTGDTTITPELNKECEIGGTLATATAVSDALVLQYYEEPDPVKAAFGSELTTEQWEKIAAITTKFTILRHGLPLVAVNAAHPLLQELRSEFTSGSRTFSFLCGHDANITGVLTAMEAEDYELPDTLEKKTPIGAKLVFERWEDKDGKEFAAVELMYQSTEQLRNSTYLSLDTPPEIYSLSFEGMEKNADGLYSYDDLLGRFDKAINAYDELVKEYGDENTLDNAA